MSYLVEQLPHCDLLRLSLSTGWFVLSARQVIRSRLSFSFPSVAHRAPVTSCLQDSTPAPDRNLVSRDSVLFLEIPSGRNLLIKTGWDGRKYPKFLGGKKQGWGLVSTWIVDRHNWKMFGRFIDLQSTPERYYLFWSTRYYTIFWVLIQYHTIFAIFYKRKYGQNLRFGDSRQLAQ